MVVGNTATEPLPVLLALTCDYHILARLRKQILGLKPVDVHILDELECIHELLVVLRKVCCHLKRRRHGHIQRELIGYCRIYPGGILAVSHICNIHHKYSRSKVHRSSVETCERQDSHMMRPVSSESLIFRTAGRFVADKVRICPAQACRTHSLMGIHHNLMLCSLFQSIQIVVDYRLAVMMFSERENISYISALYGIIAVFVHQVQSLIKMTLVITY